MPTEIVDICRRETVSHQGFSMDGEQLFPSKVTNDVNS